MIKFIILFLSFTTLSCANDFKDTAFNEQLFDGFIDVSSSDNLALRSKREVVNVAGSCQQYKQPNCCESDKYDTLPSEAFHKAKTDCYNEIVGVDVSFYNPFDCESVKQTKEDVICASECIIKKFGIMNEKGELQHDKLVAHFQRQYAEEPWKLKIVDHIVDKCLPRVRTLAVAENSKCSAEALKMMQCIWEELVQNCPADKQINSPKCNKIRENIKKNDKQFLKSVENYRFLKMFKREDNF